MRLCHQVLWKLATVLSMLLCKWVFNERFLAENIPTVHFIFDDVDHRTFCELIPGYGCNSFGVEHITNALKCCAGEVKTENLSNNYCLLRNDDVAIKFLVETVTQDVLCVCSIISRLEPFLYSPFYVTADALGF